MAYQTIRIDNQGDPLVITVVAAVLVDAEDNRLFKQELLEAVRSGGRVIVDLRGARIGTETIGALLCAKRQTGVSSVALAASKQVIDVLTVLNLAGVVFPVSLTMEKLTE